MKKTVSGYKLLFGYLGLFLIIVGIIILFPLLIIPFLSLIPGNTSGFRDAMWWPSFVIPSVLSIGIGLLLFMLLIYKKDKSRLGKHQDSLLLVMIWLAAILVGTVPFLLRNINWSNFTFDESFTFISALFETASGFCSIGLSTFTGEMLSESWNGYYIYCMYRSVLLLFGGVGLVLVVSSAISDRYGINLYQAEGHNDKLMPNLGKSAKLILGIYIGYIALGTLAYILAGMSWFDAINHSISALSTGGFTTHIESIAYFSKPDAIYGLYPCQPVAIEIISIVLMLIGSINFLTHYMLLIKRSIKKCFNDSEMKFIGISMLIFVPILVMSVLLNIKNTENFWNALRYSIFHFVSCLTTTGFSNAVNAFDGTIFGSASISIMILLMFIGGGVGSTSGAVKQQRIVLSLKSIYWNVKKRMSPKSVIIPKQIYRHGSRVNVDEEDIHEANSMIIIYFVALFIGTLLIALIKNGSAADESGLLLPHESMFEFMSAMSSTGLSLNVFSFPNIAQSASEIGIMIVLVVGMFIGRLEIMPVVFAGYRLGRDVLRKETV